MGRKKKTTPNTNIDVKPVLTNVKQIKDTPTLSLMYSGKANIQFLRKGKVVKKLNFHNEGSPYLFEFLLYCLSGNYYPNKRPYFVYPFYSDGTQERYSSNVAVPISNITVNTDNSYISYKVFLPNSIFLNTGSQYNAVTGVLFYSKENNLSNQQNQIIKTNYSMKLYFDENKSTYQITNEDIIVTWQLQIQDVSKL